MFSKNFQIQLPMLSAGFSEDKMGKSQFGSSGAFRSHYLDLD